MTKSTSKKLSRRDAIKLLGVATGAAMLANLPSKWKTPELVSGVLPAHAQTSQMPQTVYDLICSADISTNDPALVGPEPFSVTIDSVPTGSPVNGISMTWTVVGTPSAAGLGTVSGTVLTDASGIATIDLGPFVPFGWIWDGSGSATVRWEFTDPDQCIFSGCSCEQTNSWNAIV